MKGDGGSSPRNVLTQDSGRPYVDFEVGPELMLEMMTATGATIRELIAPLTLVRARFELVAMGEAHLPAWLGSTLRGGLLAAMRGLTCALRTKECAECPLRERCGYSVLFETPPDSRVDAWQNRVSWPRPIVIEPPAPRPAAWNEREALAFHMLLFGRGIDWFPYLVVAAQKMADKGLGVKRCRFELSRVVDDAAGTGNRVLFDAGCEGRELARPAVFSAAGNGSAGDAGATRVTLRFHTPVRVFEDGVRPRDLSFRLLVKALLGRVSSLAVFHCGGTGNGEYKTWLEHAGTVRTVASTLAPVKLERWSNRQQQKLPLDGLVGDVTYEGEALADFLPLLHAGVHAHVGKGTVMGLGGYEIRNASPLPGGAQ